MPKLQSLEIGFDRPNATYAPGETVTGKVVLNLSGPKIIKEIKLKVRGKAKIFWEKVHNDNGNCYNKDELYRQKEYYFNILNRLAESETGDGQITLPVEQHSYPFSFELPINIPSSFEHKCGYIRYTVKAVLDRPWRFDHEVVSRFEVLAPYDSSIQQEFAAGIDDKIERKFTTCYFFNAGIMKINVSSRTRAFAPTETIELIINYNTSSTGVNISGMLLKLIKRMTFYACSERRRKSEILEKVYKNRPFDKIGETSLGFVVPNEPFLNLKHCSIIEVDYKLVLTIYVSGMHFDIIRYYPVHLWNTVPASINDDK